MDIPNILISTVGKNPQTFKGAVSARGSWLLEPAAGWAIEHLESGKYKITHFQKSLHYSVSIGILNGTVQEMDDTFFSVLLPGGDMDWSFAASFLS